MCVSTYQGMSGSQVMVCWNQQRASKAKSCSLPLCLSISALFFFSSCALLPSRSEAARRSTWPVLKFLLLDTIRLLAQSAMVAISFGSPPRAFEEKKIVALQSTGAASRTSGSIFWSVPVMLWKGWSSKTRLGRLGLLSQALGGKGGTIILLPLYRVL